MGHDDERGRLEMSTSTVAAPNMVVRGLKDLSIRFLYGFGFLIVLILVWEWATVAVPSLFFPPPSRILRTSMELFFSGSPAHLFLTEAITVDVAGTVSRMLLGFIIGSTVGILAGTAIGRSMILRELTDPNVEFLRSIPATATLPLFIILLGGDDGMRIAFIAYAVMWFVLINTTSGVASIHRTLIDTAHTFRIGRIKTLFRVIIPAAMPRIFAGLRIGSTVSLLAAIVSELMLATNGIGHRLILAQNMFKMADLWSWLVLLAILGFLLNTLMEVIERKVLAWDSLARSQE
ncbi:ABC transporter permease [Agromyces sp. NPDC049794]|uniref:ABC transporter permease n=1 Tax=unclassified Agromyces TaxID=2639701 RepID=UPI0033FB8DEE